LLAELVLVVDVEEAFSAGLPESEPG